MGIAYRAAGSADLERLLPLVEAFALESQQLLPLYILREDFLAQVRDGMALALEHPAGCVMLAEDEAFPGPVGYAVGMLQEPPTIFRPEPYVFLSDLYVRPDQRRKGIGTALVERVRGWGWLKGVSRLSLVLPTASPAHGLYAKLGFLPVQTMLYHKDVERKDGNSHYSGEGNSNFLG